MANNPSTLPGYNGQTAAPDANYTYGSARDDATPGDLTGTPRIASEINDIMGFQQALLNKASIVPTGSPDTVLASQYLDALLKVLQNLHVRLTPATLAIAIADATVELGDILYVKERNTGSGGESFWEAVLLSGVTPSPGEPAIGDIVTSVGVPTLALKLVRDARVISINENGAPVDGTTDDKPAAQSVKDNPPLAIELLRLPEGKLKFNTSITGILTPVKGEGVGATFIDPPAADWAFNLTNSAPSQLFTRMSDFYIDGPTDFLGGKGIQIIPAFNTIIDNVRLSRLSEGITLDDSWVSKISSYRATFVADPLTLNTSNGSLVEHYYAQRFTGSALKHDDSLAPTMLAMTLENGESSATGLNLTGTHVASVMGVYTEGVMGQDVVLNTKNSGRCLNTLMTGLWLNSQAATLLIDAEDSAGLTVGYVLVHTPQAPFVIKTASLTDEFTYVDNVTQVDTNANSFVGDFRDTGQTLIPIGDDNRQIMILKPAANHGDGTQADLSNIANNTAKDTRNVCPRLYKQPVVALATVLSDADAVGSTSTIAFGTGFNIASDFYGSCKIIVVGTVTASSAAQPFFKTQWNNVTMGEVGEDSKAGSVPVSGDSTEIAMHVNVQPGINEIQFGISRDQGGGGTNTFACTELALL